MVSFFVFFCFYGNAPHFRLISLIDYAANGVTLTKLVGILGFRKTCPDSNPDDDGDPPL